MQSGNSAQSHFRKHKRLVGREDDLIYDQADPTFLATVTADRAHTYFDQLRQKLGDCKYNGPLKWDVRTGSPGTIVRLSYDGRCARGLVREVITWRCVSGIPRCSLMNYSAGSRVRSNN